MNFSYDLNAVLNFNFCLMEEEIDKESVLIAFYDEENREL